MNENRNSLVVPIKKMEVIFMSCWSYGAETLLDLAIKIVESTTKVRHMRILCGSGMKFAFISDRGTTDVVLCLRRLQEEF